MIEIKQLYKSFGANRALNGVSYYIKHGEAVCVIGPSGGGKSTFLRCIGKLETPDAGEVITSGGVCMVGAGADADEALAALKCAGAADTVLFDEPSADVIPVIHALVEGGMTAVIVTSEMKLAREVSSRVLFMKDGVITENGTPEDVFCHPQLASTREFLASAV